MKREEEKARRKREKEKKRKGKRKGKEEKEKKGKENPSRCRSCSIAIAIATAASPATSLPLPLLHRHCCCCYVVAAAAATLLLLLLRRLSKSCLSLSISCYSSVRFFSLLYFPFFLYCFVATVATSFFFLFSLLLLCYSCYIFFFSFFLYCFVAASWNFPQLIFHSWGFLGFVWRRLNSPEKMKKQLMEMGKMNKTTFLGCILFLFLFFDSVSGVPSSLAFFYS